MRSHVEENVMRAVLMLVITWTVLASEIVTTASASQVRIKPDPPVVEILILVSGARVGTIGVLGLNVPSGIGVDRVAGVVSTVE